MPTESIWRRPLVVFLFLLVLGFVTDFALDSFIQFTMIVIMINMILGMSLNLVNGFTGQFSLGHAGFMAVGAYTSAYLAEQWFTHVGPITGAMQLVMFPLFGVCAGLMAALAGLLVGLPSLRLRGDYLAIVTLGFAEIIRVTLLNTEAVGAARGFYDVKGPDNWMLGPIEVSRFLTSYGLALFWVLVTFYVIWRVVRSGHGRAFLSVRDDEIAAEAMGINTVRAKVQAFAISSFFAGIAGSIFAHYMNYLNPQTFVFTKSVDAVIIVVLGGMGSLSGSLFAAAIVTVIPELLRPLQEIIGIDLRMLIYALLLILMMILRPRGLFGSQELSEILRKYVRKST
ncbi:MAG: branched-chain amino acid ABC transporter permease [Bdellovibrionaceae bacterium]|nr:branched-chain amino acid ABC transporter permease [Pseudobdellovibrionaceae bacterium]